MLAMQAEKCFCKYFTHVIEAKYVNRLNYKFNYRQTFLMLFFSSFVIVIQALSLPPEKKAKKNKKNYKFDKKQEIKVIFRLQQNQNNLRTK